MGQEFKSLYSYESSSKKSTSKYLGVSYIKRDRKWLVAIKFDGKQKTIGLLKDEVEAAKLYDKHAKIYHGEFANLNFKD